MSAHELAVVWPAFFRARARERKVEQDRAADKARRR